MGERQRARAWASAAWVAAWLALVVSAAAARGVARAGEGAPLVWEGQGGPALWIKSGGALGAWRVVDASGEALRTLEVPLDWAPEGTWRAERRRGRGGKQVTVWRQIPADGKPDRAWFWGGDGDPRADALLWRGRADGAGEAAALELITAAGGFAEVRRVVRPPLLPAGCEGLASPWLAMVYDLERGRWVASGAASGASAQAPPKQSLTLAPIAAPAWGEAVSGAAHDAAALWLTDDGARADAAKASRDGREDTAWRPPGGDVEVWWVWRPHGVAPPQRLLLGLPEGAQAGRATLAWDGGEAALTWGGGARAVGAALPPGARASKCVSLRWPAGQPMPSEVALWTTLDDQPRATAVAALAEEALRSDLDPTRRAALAALLAHHPDPLLAYLQGALDAASEASLLSRALDLSERLPLAQRLTVAAALATHPNTAPPDLQRALAQLDKHPKPAAAALSARLRALDPASPAYLSAALRLAKLPTPDAINPLLGLIDRACAAQEDARRDTLLTELVAVGPAIAGPLIGFVAAPAMPTPTRQALLRALVRVGAAAAAQPAPPDASPLLPLLDDPDLQTRLLTIRALATMRADVAADRLRARALDADSDIERAERVTALAALSAPPDLTLLQRAAFDDPSPTVRIAAAAALATPSARADARALLLRILDREPWPEARAAALSGLCALSDPAALLRAAAALDDADAAPPLRAAAAQSLTAHPAALLRDPDRLTAWLDDPTLDRNARVAFLNAITTHPDAPTFLTAYVTRARAAHRADPDRGGLLLAHALLALHRADLPPADLAPLLLDSLDAAQHPALAVGLITLLSVCDHPSTRARLLSERDGTDPARRAAAASALDRLNGASPSLPADDLPWY